ncbi:sensor histidine kinase [Ancylomarina sp. DW003]|nr:sensor histidine kinase [Ancylomarina sp. DW003]MDE5420588.1 sensor histidine kinase [Ancylomarina sp. DW003]
MNTKKRNLHISIWLGLLSLRILSLLENHSFLDSLLTALPLYLTYVIVFYSASEIHKRIYKHQKYIKYAIFMLATISLGTALIKLISYSTQVFTENDSHIILDYFGFFRVLFFAFFGVIYQELIGKKRTEDKNKSLMLEKRETELLFLKSQMNPHFFFNTLNNIYGLAYQKEDSAPTAILKLSEAMRYIIYETQSDRVTLNKELQFINNYIKLERLRLLNKDNLNFQNEIGLHAGKIAPLILLPFIENCFKHSNIDESEQSEINISIWIENHYLHLSCGNTISKKANYKEGGIGTKNVTKRLKLLYGDNFSLEKEEDENNYFTLLRVPIEE